ncbi:hypothetical protein [uncultured Georgenia sp.]|uniref:hypothetical protein n=1 Tax=uncultured Georgenia sp. TaxID=378209 RepID=UPI002627A592|nr:hypothetical protein [uncultured Georgenia sp.]HLV03682.1 hypothetical protein [Actinomycetaceae bacterium]
MRTTRRGLAVALGAAAGAALGVAGTSLALWGDTVSVAGRLGTGYEYFAVGAPGQTAPAPSGTAVFTLGPEHAARLMAEHELAVPIQVDSLSQGNKGLSYEVAPPASWGDGILGTAQVSIFRVDSAAACHVGAQVPTHVELVSTPVPATYTTDTDPTTEYWCLLARYDGSPPLGEYTNTATVTATDPNGTEVSDEDTWHAEVRADLDPAAEPEHHITFTYETFRPGEEP